ncbi:MAG: SAV_915 family protein [Actinophytocola sp.]|jgi:hypothetical protein|uniref:SAV_915 family protein n=1 Tax=Actinophytocola sp. TaxID=1872138 RepID=UPI003D6A04DA
MEETTDHQASLPPVVYVPCSDDIQAGELTVDLRPTRDGRVALLVYSALDRLVSCCGPNQPWVVMPTVDLDKIAERVRFDMILLDLEIPEEHRRKVAAVR